MPRFFAEIREYPAAAIVDRKALRHITGALRMQKGDVVPIRTASQGYRARIVSISAREIVLAILDHEELHDRTSARIHLALSMFDMKDFDHALRHVTELGVAEIHPVVSSRSSVRSITGERHARWRSIILEAVKQCDRRTIPEIYRPERLDDFVRGPCRLWGKRLLAHRDARMSIAEATGSDVGILIGPEGGFSPEEIDLVIENGFQPVHMGRSVLRAVTAAITAAGILGLNSP